MTITAPPPASTVEKILKQIPELQTSSDPVIADRRYLRKLSELAGSALQKNCDIMQLPNGDVVVSEVKTMFYTYKWDAEKGKFVRSKSKNPRRRSTDDEDDEDETESFSPPKKRGRKPGVKNFSTRVVEEVL